MAHEDCLTVRCTGERSQTAPQGSVQSDSDREGERRFNRRVVGGNRRCQRLRNRVRLNAQPEPPALYRPPVDLYLFVTMELSRVTTRMQYLARAYQDERQAGDG